MVVVGGCHVLGAGDDEALVVAEPKAIQHEGVEPIHRHPEGVGGQGAAPERRAAIRVAHQQAQQDAKEEQGGNLFGVDGRAARLVACVDEAQLLAARDNGRGIIVDAFDRVPGEQEDEEREVRARDQGFDQEGHSVRL